MGKWRDPNPEWPVPVRKVLENGTVDTQYPANTKAYDKLCAAEEDGGLGYTPQKITTDYPKTMSHPVLTEVLVKNEAEEKQRMKQGYSFDHWANKMEREARANIDKAEANTEYVIDPKAQHRIEKLEKQIEQLLEAKKK